MGVSAAKYANSMASSLTVSSTAPPIPPRLLGCGKLPPSPPPPRPSATSSSSARGPLKPALAPFLAPSAANAEATLFTPSLLRPWWRLPLPILDELPVPFACGLPLKGLSLISCCWFSPCFLALVSGWPVLGSRNGDAKFTADLRRRTHSSSWACGNCWAISSSSNGSRSTYGSRRSKKLKRKHGCGSQGWRTDL